VKKIIFRLTWAVWLFTLAGCADLANTPQALVVVASPTATELPTSTSLPTIAAATSTATPSITPTPQPTSTPLPSATPQCVESSGRLDTGDVPSRVVAGGRVPYIIYFPPCYDTRVRYPVVYLLHGTPFNERHWLDLGLKEAVDQAIHSRRAPPFVIVLPRGDLEGTFGNTSGGNGSFEQVIIEEVIPYIDTIYNTLATKQGREIGGISRGAVWALEIAFRNPDLFGAVGGHSSALSVNLAPPVYDPIDIAQTDQAEALRTLRISLDAGDADWSLPGTVELRDALDAKGIPNSFHVGQGVHDATYWSSQMQAYVDFYSSGFVGLIANSTTP
jgi:enterochelin esterase-like enzyme